MKTANDRTVNAYDHSCFLGIDLGSTTAKYVLLNAQGQVLAHNYVRHQSAVVEVLLKELSMLSEYEQAPLYVTFTGSAALSLASSLHAPFIQEVIAATTFLKNSEHGVDVAIELGGEDGKILFLNNGVELRMNEACAGGTGAFIDQMATLLNVSTMQLNELAQQATSTHPIASRCGVFAKTDLVALLNQGISKADIAKSVFDAVCEQTISGLACGRTIEGNVAFLGGPLSFLTELKASFITKIEQMATSAHPVNFLEFSDTQYAIAHGAALSALKEHQEQLRAAHQASALSSSPCLDVHHPARSRSNSSSESTAIREPSSSSTPDLGAQSTSLRAASTTIAVLKRKLEHTTSQTGSARLTPLFPAALPPSADLPPSANLAPEVAPELNATATLSTSAERSLAPATPNATSLYGLNESYEAFSARHAQHSVAIKDLTQAHGPLFLGIDLGSTTVKLVVTDQAQEIVASYYGHNGGEPLKNLLPQVQSIVTNLPEDAYIAACCTTGYGADLAKAALNAAYSEVETLAHQKAAVAFDPEVSYVIDIGGQDMKCIKVHQGVIASIQLNEACSSGCGSFLETFAAQLQLKLPDFVQAALQAQAPCDLGTRCTVFMNSKVKQAQRDNVPIGDIAAGLCLSIVRNALYKVLRIHDPAQLGDHVVVQGGTFLNDAILRAFELNLGKDVIRPNIAGLMGAYGCALIAQERYHQDRASQNTSAHSGTSAALIPERMSFSPEQFDLSTIKTSSFRCKGCNNHCALTMNTFLSGQKYLSGNRCDFALDHGGQAHKDGTNQDFYSYKLDLLFNRPILYSRAQHAEAAAKAEALQKQKELARQAALAQAQKRKEQENAAPGSTEQTGSAPGARPALSARAQAAAQAAARARARKAAARSPEQEQAPAHPSASPWAEAKVKEVVQIKTAARIAAATAHPCTVHEAAQTAEVLARQQRISPFGPLAEIKTPAGQPVISADFEVATRGTIGIPRVLNMFEHYPFWHALLTGLGFSVELSPVSSKEIAALGSQTIPSQSLCFPAKLTHSHLCYLAEQGIKRIFLPCVPRENSAERFVEGDDSYACPVVGGYPEALKLNLKSTYPELELFTPYVSLESDHSIIAALQELDPSLKARTIKPVIEQARHALHSYHQQVTRHAQQEILRARAQGLPIIVLSGHPYHLDPLINHGLPALIASMGTVLVSEDAVAPMIQSALKLDVVNQWAFHSRLYRAAQYVLEHDDAQMVQLVSFGCGIDAITSEQVKKMLESHQRLYTMLKIDEGDTLGAAKIRLRSLLCACADQRRSAQLAHTAIACTTSASASTQHQQSSNQSPDQYPSTTGSATIQSLSTALSQDTLKQRTLYMPQMAPIHFPLLATALEAEGYHIKLLEDVSPHAIELGLKHINNDACYPAIVAIGQLLEPITQGQIDPEHSALLLAQTCGPCRATNYPALLKWALDDLQAQNIPIVTVQGSDLKDEKLHLKLGLSGLKRLILALLYGDLLQTLYLHCHTYEQVPGTALKLVEQYQQELKGKDLTSKQAFIQRVKQIVADFEQIPLRCERRPKVGIVGEILLKYHPTANNDLVEHIIAEGAEPVLGDITAFVLYCLHDVVFQAQHLKASKLKAWLSHLTLQHFERYRRIIIAELKHTQFLPPPTFAELLASGQKLVSLGQQAGEGWLLTAEMIDFIEHGVSNILCVQPFACLPNHVTGKGMMRPLRELYPKANTCAIDFEAGSAQSNVLNRIKLFITQAKDNLWAQEQQLAPEQAPTQALAHTQAQTQEQPALTAAPEQREPHQSAPSFSTSAITHNAAIDLGVGDTTAVVFARRNELYEAKRNLIRHTIADNDEQDYAALGATAPTPAETGSDKQTGA